MCNQCSNPVGSNNRPVRWDDLPALRPFCLSSKTGRDETMGTSRALVPFASSSRVLTVPPSVHQGDLHRLALIRKAEALTGSVLYVTGIWQTFLPQARLQFFTLYLAFPAFLNRSFYPIVPPKKKSIPDAYFDTLLCLSQGWESGNEVQPEHKHLFIDTLKKANDLVICMTATDRWKDQNITDKLKGWADCDLGWR